MIVALPRWSNGSSSRLLGDFRGSFYQKFCKDSEYVWYILKFQLEILFFLKRVKNEPFFEVLTVMKICVFFMHLFLLCVESVCESLNSDFRLPHFCLPWPYTLSYRLIIYTGMKRTVRPICWCKLLCWNVKNKGSFDVAKTKKANFLVIFGKKIKMFLLIVAMFFDFFKKFQHQ